MSNGTQPEAPRPSFELFSNWLSLVGIAFLAVCFALGVVLAVADRLATEGIPYLGVAYVLIALIATSAGALVLGGALRTAWRRRRGRKVRGLRTISVDLGRPRDRVIAVASLSGVVLVVVVTTFGAYETVAYVESDAFCGGACHSVMHPEALAHKLSPHANVACVECHVGSGAGSFAESKLRGVRQLAHVISGSFARPIAVPIRSLRPARETCEHCHWRERWAGYKESMHTYFSREPDNKQTELRMLVKVGGARAGLMTGDGIHYHMMIGRTVEFAATDPNKQDIVWVRVREPDGRVKVFQRGDVKGENGPPEGATLHHMDCLDCHNRPAHRFLAPMTAMNLYLAAGRIDPSLPSIKKKGVEVLSAEYPDSETAKRGIAKALREFYAKDQQLRKPEAIAMAVAAIQEIYANNVFPEMKVRWSSYPDNLGHRDSPGCFRCHNDGLKDAAGQTVFTTCTKCHVVLTQSANNGEDRIDFAEGQTFFHSADEEHIHAYTDCSVCHTGGADTY